MQCNRCGLTSPDSGNFFALHLMSPCAVEQAAAKSRSEEWDEEEAAMDMAEALFAGYTRTQPAAIDELHLHLCPRCASWFQRLFHLNRVGVKRNKRVKKAKVKKIQKANL